MEVISEYIGYISKVRRYSQRTVDLYSSVLRDYSAFAAKEGGNISDEELISALNVSEIREYEMRMLDSKPPKSPSTVHLHLSALSSFCRFLMSQGRMTSNPVKLVRKPKAPKRLPHFFRKEALDDYFRHTSWIMEDAALDAFCASWNSKSGRSFYSSLLGRMIISTLYSTGVRRAELIGMNIDDVDIGRNVVKVRGKGDKMREIPLIPSLSQEIILYLRAVEAMCGGVRSLKEPLFVTYAGKRLYPAYVDKAVKRELGDVKGITGRRSPHVLRHSLATGLMNEDVDLNTIKELLGHSSLAATQVYTHSTVARLKAIYEQAHPRAKKRR